MKFIELLKDGKDYDCDVISGDEEMSCAFVWDHDMFITRKCQEMFSSMLVSPVQFLSNGCIEILCDNGRLADQFFTYLAGYCSIETYDSLFREMEEK